jgi:outer membrane protein OmpA-like peptidoglycan-associated protein
MKKLLLLICIASAFNTNAQTADKKWNIGIHAGVSQYNGDLGNDFYSTNMHAYGVGGISISRYLGEHFALDFISHKGRIGIDRPVPEASFRSSFTSLLMNLRFNFFNSNAVINPYLFVGGGGILFDKNIDLGKDNIARKMDFAAPAFGGGINIKMGPVVTFNIQETFINSNSDSRDGNSISKGNDMYLFHTAGLTFSIGKKKDSDKDGVADRNDKCPNTPAGLAVDSKGCPLDRDKDGVADYLDACPDIAGLATLQGCPDKDGDGIADKDDRCPDVAGTMALHGCPDKDGDGIADIDDRCPDIAGSLAMKGCPDTDKDGVADIDDKCPGTKAGYKVDVNGCPFDNDNDGVVNEEDRCPNAAGPQSLKGCPDTDGDGVPDIDDRCPRVKGTIANKGCPEIAKEDVVRITRIASKIFFENNSDKLKVASLVQLDELAAILNRYEAANLTVEGHTDNVGKDDANMILSQKRTESVKRYLATKGIIESRLTATGFGETKPIADNKTSLGRAKNRRVELKTSY